MRKRQLRCHSVAVAAKNQDMMLVVMSIAHQDTTAVPDFVELGKGRPARLPRYKRNHPQVTKVTWRKSAGLPAVSTEHTRVWVHSFPHRTLALQANYLSGYMR